MVFNYSEGMSLVKQEEYVQLMYFYRSFFKEIFGEAMDLIGRRGIMAILRVAARKFAESRIAKSKIAQTNFIDAIKTLMRLSKPEVYEDGTIILKRCPFRARPSKESPNLEEDVFCGICAGFINGISANFNGPYIRLVESRIRKAKQCKFVFV